MMAIAIGPQLPASAPSPPSHPCLLQEHSLDACSCVCHDSVPNKRACCMVGEGECGDLGQGDQDTGSAGLGVTQ